jgi:molybdenum cofactor cytidylyltransferase
MTEQLTAIVLAAGLSRRMGKENKLLLPFSETIILAATLSNILTARVGETHVVVGHEAAEVVTALMSNSKFQTDLPLDTSHFTPHTSHLTPHISKKGPLSIIAKKDDFFTILMNNHYEEGMTTTIQTGVEAASDTSKGYLICLSDMPFITPSEYQFLVQAFLNILAKDPQAIVQPAFEGNRGNPTIFAAYYRKDILNLTYTEGCKPIVQANAEHVYAVEMPTDSVLKDIDSKEDYAGIMRME